MTGENATVASAYVALTKPEMYAPNLTCALVSVPKLIFETRHLVLLALVQSTVRTFVLS